MVMEAGTGRERMGSVDARSLSVSSPNTRSFTLRSLTRPSIAKADVSKSQSKGPLGLTTLWNPPDHSIADIVFVHGLNGGSQSTWSYNGDASTFWPREWLPEDVAFQDVRLHSFGYNSGWSQESILHINDFAHALLASIQDSPAIKNGASGAPLILIAHSMGGLVAKKAYILSKQIHAFEALSNRIFAIFFLATPHRGSNMAELLTRMLALGGARPFVRELHRNSPTIQAINEEFPRFSGDLQLFSFFETLPMNYGIGKGLIVDKESAVLNYPNERTAYLNANHRDVARFPTRADTAYVTVRNALATTIDLLRVRQRSTNHSLFAEQRQALEAFLGVNDAPEDTLGRVANSYLDGSCEWFVRKDSFCRWRDNAYSELLWVQGKPGAGKTILSGHVIAHLQRHTTPKDCCFYFFSRSDKPRCTISAFLRSMAFQLAVMHPEILTAVIEILKEWKDSKIGDVDHSPIWRRLFVNGILKVKLNTPQYWVIDGLDECKQGSELLGLLVKAQEMWPLCIMVTCRDAFDTMALFQPKNNIRCEHIQENDTKSDISLLIDARIRAIPAKDEEMKYDIRQSIIDRSAGSFLWVDLVLTQLQKVQLSADVKRVLHSVPSDMNELYHNILASMSEEAASVQLAQAILRWASCASRPITTEELHTALELDLGDTVSNVERSIAVSCGHLVYVDSQSRVQLVHQTAREFLTSSSIESEFTINKATGHRNLALACLKYLTGPEMRPLKPRKLSVSTEVHKRSPFVQYAAVSLFDHVSNAGDEGQALIPDLIQFFDSPNVLTWIEFLSENAGLSRLLQAGKTIHNLLKSGMYHGIVGISRDKVQLESWGTDLVRLVSKFGRQLQSQPHAIHDLIAPFCPTNSAIYKRFASPRGLHLVGLTEKGWNDCSSTISHNRGVTITAVVCSDKHIALGTMQRKISLYSQSTYQLTRSIDDDEPVMLLAFGDTGKLIASAGTRSIKIFSVDNGSRYKQIPISSRCMSISFVNNDGMLLAALRNNEFLYWDLLSETTENARWTIDPDVRESLDFLTPTAAAISLSQGLLAVSYRAHDILVWNFSEEVLHDHYCRETGSRINVDENLLRKASVLALIFGAAPESSALVAGYMDGELVLYDTELAAIRCSVHGVNAQTMCSSPDGRTLATGDAAGTIRIFDLESLRFLYKISFDAEFIAVRSLAFTDDNYRLLDIRARQCRIWEPISLLRQEADDANSDALSASTMPLEVEFEGPMNIVYITAVACSQSGDYIVCGKDDGTVHLYRTATGQHMQCLFSHGAAITVLFFHESSGTIVCSDQSSRITCRRLITQARSNWQVEMLHDTSISDAIVQILPSVDFGRLLVSTAEEDQVITLRNPADDCFLRIRDQSQTPFAWVSLPMSTDKLLYLSGTQAIIYAWATLERVSSAFIIFDDLVAEAESIKFIPLPKSHYLATVSERTTHGQPETHLWTHASIQEESTRALSTPEFKKVSQDIDHIIGVYNQRLVFFHVDGWVCSMDLCPLDVNSVQRHFSIPADWQSLNSKAMMSLTPQGDVVISKRSELVIVRRGLEAARHVLGGRATTMSGKLQGVGGSRRTVLSERPRIQRVSRSVT